MDSLDRMNAAVSYIEDHLDEMLDFKKVAQIACCSSYQFQRVFSFVTGVTLSEYVRRRRLSIAAFELQNSCLKIIDIALKYGYESPAAFTRAFQAMHGIAPMLARTKGVSLKTYPRITFQLIIKGVVEMNYKIIAKEEFILMGKKRVLPLGDNEAESQIWNEFFEDGTNTTLFKNRHYKEPFWQAAVALDNNNGLDATLFIGAEYTGTLPEGMDTITIPAGTWAVFTVKGTLPNAVCEMVNRIEIEWLPASDYKRTGNIFDLEVFPQGDPNSNDYISYIWIPIIQK